MKRIKISAELEREIRDSEELASRAMDVVEKIIRLLDAETPRKPAPGIGYARIVELLRIGLGARLAVPEKPHVSWIVKQVNRVKELGFDELQLETLGKCANEQYRNSRPVELEFVLRAAVRLLSQSVQEPASSVVFTGRLDEDS